MISLFPGRAIPASTPLTGRSLWQRHAGAPGPELDGAGTQRLRTVQPLPARVGLAVVGGGLAGLSTALALAEAEPSADIVVLEARFMGFGASGRNAGLISPLPAPLWLASADTEPEHLWGLGNLNARTHRLAAWLSAEATDSVVEPRVLRIEAQGRLTALGLARVARLIERAGLAHRRSQSPAGHLCVEIDTHTLDPYRTVRALAALAQRRGVRLAEGTPVAGVEETAGGVRIALGDGREIAARAAVVCTNAYSGSLALPERPAAKVVHNFMVAAGSPASDPHRAAGSAPGSLHGAAGSFVVELNSSYVYYRIDRGHVVYGGIERFKPYGDSDFAVPPDVLAGLERLLERSFPGARLTPIEAWGGVYHQTSTDLPVLKRTGARGSIVLNVGYGGTGVAMTMICGQLAAALALGGRPADPDDRRLLAALAGTRMPVAALARFAAAVAGDVVMLRRA